MRAEAAALTEREPLPTEGEADPTESSTVGMCGGGREDEGDVSEERGRVETGVLLSMSAYERKEGRLEAFEGEGG